MTTASGVLMFVAHSRKVQEIAALHGWLPGARYTNLRDVKLRRLGFLDIDWRNYDFRRHLDAARRTRPVLTVARDVESRDALSQTIDEANALAEFARRVVVVPKTMALAEDLNHVVPAHMILGFSVPTRYGATPIPPRCFKRPVHLLGGRPDVQRALANEMAVVSLDCNRFTLDAGYGDYFDGKAFRPHPRGGYESCLRDSIANITNLWSDYRVSPEDWLES